MPVSEKLPSLVELGNRLREARVATGETQAQLAARLGVSVPTLRAMENGASAVAIGTWVRAADLLGLAPGIERHFDGARPGKAAAGSVTLAADRLGDLALLLGPAPEPGDAARLVGSLIAKAADERRRTLAAREELELRTTAAKQALLARIRSDPHVVEAARAHLGDIPDPWLRAQWQAFLALPMDEMARDMSGFRCRGGAPWQSMIQSSPFSRIAP